MVINNVLGPAYDNVGRPYFSKRNEHFAFYFERNGYWHMMIDGIEGPGYDSLLISPSIFSEDGKHFAYAAEHKAACLHGFRCTWYLHPAGCAL